MARPRPDALRSAPACAPRACRPCSSPGSRSRTSSPTRSPSAGPTRATCCTGRSASSTDEVIYKDFFEGLTPLSFYLVAGIYRVAGTTLLAARVGIALIEAIGCALLFHLVRRVAGVAEAVLAALIFAGICIPTWPYASPHWISTTLGLAVAAVTLAERWAASSRARPALAGLLAGVAVCVQQQRGVFLAAWLPLALVVLACRRVRAPDAGRRLAPRARVGRRCGRDRRRRRARAGRLACVTGSARRDALRLRRAPVRRRRSRDATRGRPSCRSRRRVGALHLDLAPAGGAARSSSARACFSCAGPGAAGRERTWSARVSGCSRLLMALSVLYLPDFIHVSFVLPFLLIPGASLLHAVRTAPRVGAVPAGRHARDGRRVGLRRGGRGPGCRQRRVRPRPRAGALRDGLRRRCARSRTSSGCSARSAVTSSASPTVAASCTRTRTMRGSTWRCRPTTPPASACWCRTSSPEEYVDEALAVLRARRPARSCWPLPFTPERVRRVVEEGYDAVRGRLGVPHLRPPRRRRRPACPTRLPQRVTIGRCSPPIRRLRRGCARRPRSRRPAGDEPRRSRCCVLEGLLRVAVPQWRGLVPQRFMTTHRRRRPRRRAGLRRADRQPVR